MSIISELENSATYLRQARNAILGRGGEISATAGLKDLSEAIYSIPADGSLAYETDDTIQYTKRVPSGVSKFGAIDRIGGMNYRCNNLIPYPYYSNYNFKQGDTYTESGITFTRNENGTITANGTATANVIFYFVQNMSPSVLKGSSFSFSGMSITGSTSTIFIALQILRSDGSFITGANLVDTNGRSIDYTPERQAEAVKINIYLYIYKGITVENATFAPMLNVGTTALPYEPYFTGLRTSKVTEIISVGKNLFNKDAERGVSSIQNGVLSNASNYYSWIIDVKGLDKITVTNNYTGGKHFYLSILSSTREGTIPKDGYMFAVSSSSSKTFSVKSDTYEGRYAMISIWRTDADNIIPFIQVEAGSSSTEFVPYSDPIHYTIPTEVCEINGYGDGINDTYYNYIDLTTKEFVKCVDTVVLNGSETWNFNGAVGELYNYLFYNVGEPGIYDDTAILCDDYAPTTIWHTSNVGIDSYNDTSKFRIWVRPFNMGQYTTIAQWKADLAENPLVIKIPKKVPIRENIADKLGTFRRTIKVQSGGKLTFVNEHSNAVPSTIQYVLEVE